MKPFVTLFIGMLLLCMMVIVPLVSADATCSFINITAGPPGPMNQTPNMTAGPEGPIPDSSQFCFLNGTRAMTGNVSMGGFYINNLTTGDLAGDAVNRSYVDSVAGSSYNASYVTLTNTSYVLTNNNSYILGTNTSYFLIDGTRTMTGNITMGSMYITGLLSGSSGGSVVNKSYVDSVASSYNASYVTLTNGSYVQVTNTSYVLTDGTRAMAANLSLGSKYINSLISGALGTDAVNKSYVDSVASSYNATYDAKPSSTYNATYDAKAPATVFGYVTLMAGSSMVATTNPATMNQWETTTYKNNYISLNFTDGGTETAQWIVDFPADWNRTGNVIFTPLWTASSGANTVNWTIAGKLLGDDAALDTQVVNISSIVDTLITAGDLHVADPTAGAVITGVGTGNTAIIKVIRDPGDTGTFTAELIGLRIKYIRTLA